MISAPNFVRPNCCYSEEPAASVATALPLVPDFAKRTAVFVPPLDWPETWRIAVVVATVTAVDDAAASRRSLGDPGSLMHRASAIAG